MSTARFISFEGVDGAGKSTHIEAVAKWLCQRGREVVRTREPGGTELAERLRELLLSAHMDALTEVLLMFAARRDHINQVINPALARGATVLCDRFTDATFAYQGAGRGFELGVLAQLEHWVQHGLQPNLTFWFDLPAKVACQRREQVRDADRFEAMNLDFFERVNAGYRARAEAEPARFCRVDASLAPHQVAAQILSILESRSW